MKKNEKKLVMLKVDELYPHPDNPRKEIGDIDELSESIKAKGILQNLTVVKGHRADGEEKEDGYTVLIGHRRLAAAKKAGVTELPCVITEMSLQEQVATMLLENMQRSDLTVYEQAKGFQMMLDLGETVETLSEKSGFSESTVRRRIKLLELDEDAFKRSAARNVSLFEYAELDRIKDARTKNRLLEYTGTANFKNELESAVDAEKRNAYLDEAEAEISKFAKKTDSLSGMFFKKDYCTYRQEEVKIPDDADTVEYFYKRASYGISLYYKKEVTAEAEAEERKEEEERAEKDRRKAVLEEASERAYKLRKEAINAVTNTQAQKHLTDIMSFFMKINMVNGYTNVDEKEIFEIVGFNPKDEAYCDFKDEEIEKIAYRQIESAAKANPALCLLKCAYAFAEDDKDENYYDWNGEYTENCRLDMLYELLCRLGYEMSDEEKALQDGTHESYC